MALVELKIKHSFFRVLQWMLEECGAEFRLRINGHPLKDSDSFSGMKNCANCLATIATAAARPFTVTTSGRGRPKVSRISPAVFFSFQTYDNLRGGAVAIAGASMPQTDPFGRDFNFGPRPTGP